MISIDIESTGLTADDKLTVIGFAHETGYEILYNTEVSRLDESSFDWESSDKDVSLNACRNERRLLTKIDSVIDDHNLQMESQILTGFNADGFDFPLLRTRCLEHELGWAFGGINYLDLMWVFKKRWNTTAMDVSGFNKTPLRNFGKKIGAPVTTDHYKAELVEVVEDHGYSVEQVSEFANDKGKDMPTSSYGDLESVYEQLIGADLFDPLDSSKEAVPAWNKGNIGKIIKHNLCDIRMTQELMELLPEYIPDDDLKVTEL